MAQGGGSGLRSVFNEPNYSLNFSQEFELQANAEFHSMPLLTYMSAVAFYVYLHMIITFPLAKQVKGMFLQASVILSTQRGVCLGRGVCVFRQTPSLTYLS